MTVRDVKNAMIRLERQGYDYLPVHMFAHDHDDTKCDEGVGIANSVDIVEQDNFQTIVSLRS